MTHLDVTADHVKLYKRALLEAGMASATVARRLSVLRGAYEQLAAKGFVSWETAQDIAAVKAPGVQKNATPSLTQKQAIALLQAIPTDSLQGIRDLALMSVFFLTGCRVSAVTGACVGHMETNGVEHYLNVTEKRNKKRRKILLDAARPVLAYVAQAGIKDDKRKARSSGPCALTAWGWHGDTSTARPPGGWSRSIARWPGSTWRGGRPGHRHPLVTEDRYQRRHPQRGFDARGKGVRGARRHPDYRALLRPQGRGRGGGGPANPDPADRFQGPASPLAAVPEILTAEPGVLHDATSEVISIVYGMWMRLLRSLPGKTHSGLSKHC